MPSDREPYHVQLFRRVTCRDRERQLLHPEGLGCLLNSVLRGIAIVARVDSHPETLTAIRQYRPHVLIVGIRTPRVNAEGRALSAAQQLRSQYPNHCRGGYC